MHCCLSTKTFSEVHVHVYFVLPRDGEGEGGLVLGCGGWGGGLVLGCGGWVGGALKLLSHTYTCASLPYCF